MQLYQAKYIENTFFLKGLKEGKRGCVGDTLPRFLLMLFRFVDAISFRGNQKMNLRVAEPCRTM